MEEYFKSLGYYVEIVQRNKEHEVLSKLLPKEKSVIYFDMVGDFYLNIIYEKQFKSLKEEFYNKAGLNLIFLPNIDFPDVDNDSLHYLIPHLNNRRVSFTRDLLMHEENDKEKDDFNFFSYYKHHYQTLFEYFGYNGDIKSGIIYIPENESSNIYIIKHTNEEHFSEGQEDPKDSIIEYVNMHKPMVFESRENDFIQSKQSFLEKLDDSLDEETKDKIKNIYKQIEEFKDSGTLMYILPLLKKTLHKYEEQIDLNSVSKINVDTDYNITLPYFNNMEIPLSHLTKTVYILFVNHPEGIDIKNLYNYKNELKDLYSDISYQENTDKMEQTILDLIDPSKNAIYSHISRIKSVFYKLMDKFYADNYIITGYDYGNSMKYIPIINNYNAQNEYEQRQQDLIDRIL